MSNTELHSLSEEEEVQETKKTRKRSRKEGVSSVSEESSTSATPETSEDSSLSEEEKPKKKKKRRKRRSSSRVAPSDTSNVVKYRLTFLMDQRFKGTFYRKGDTLEVPEHIFNAYKQRRRLLEFKKM